MLRGLIYRLRHIFQVEICRYGCPDHCQKPNSYTAREQTVSASVNVPQYKAQPQYKPGPRFEAHKKPVDRIRARQDVNDVKNNEIPQPARLVQPQQQQQQQRPQAESLPRPQALIQPEAPRPKFEETVRSVGSKPDKVKDKGWS